MDTLAAKLLLMIAFPIVVTVVWQRLTRSAWYLLLFALGAYIVVHMVKIPVGQVIPHLLRFSYSNPDWGYFPYWTANLAIKGLFAEGIHWLSLRFGAGEVKFFQGEDLSWQEGVMFGLGYTIVVMLITTGEYFYTRAWDAGVLSPVDPLTPAFFSLFQPGWLDEGAIQSLNEVMPWWDIMFMTVGFGGTHLMFNVGSSLVLFLSIQRQSVALFLVAVGYYIVFVLAPRILIHLSSSSTPNIYSYFFIVSLPFLLILRLRKTLPSENT